MQWLTNWLNWFASFSVRAATNVGSSLAWFFALGRWAKGLFLAFVTGVVGFGAWTWGKYNHVLDSLPSFDLSWLSPFISVVDTFIDINTVGTALATFVSMRILGFNFMFTWLMLRFFKKSGT